MNIRTNDSSSVNRASINLEMALLIMLLVLAVAVSLSWVGRGVSNTFQRGGDLLVDSSVIDGASLVATKSNTGVGMNSNEYNVSWSGGKAPFTVTVGQNSDGSDAILVVDSNPSDNTALVKVEPGDNYIQITDANNAAASQIVVRSYSVSGFSKSGSMGLALQGNTAYVWGSNSYGQMGAPASATSGECFPVSMPYGAAPYTDVQRGLVVYNSTWLWRSNGHLYVSGGPGGYGALGINNPISATNAFVQFPRDDIVDLDINNYAGIFLGADGTVYGSGDNMFRQVLVSSTTPLAIAGVPKSKDVEMGQLSSFAITRTGDLWGGGYNMYGELGVGDKSSHSWAKINLPGPALQVKSITDGTMVLLADGRVFGAGSNDGNRFGWGAAVTESTSFQQVTAPDNIAEIILLGGCTRFLLKDGTVKGFGGKANYSYGYGADVSPKTVPTDMLMTNVRYLAACDWHAAGTSLNYFINKDGEIYISGFDMGSNPGMYNNSTLLSSTTPIRWRDPWIANMGE